MTIRHTVRPLQVGRAGLKRVSAHVRVDAPRARARGQCVVCGCVDSPRAARARRSARIRQSSTNPAIAKTSAAARVGIQWSRTSIMAKPYSFASIMMPRAMQSNPAATIRTRGSVLTRPSWKNASRGPKTTTRIPMSRIVSPSSCCALRWSITADRRSGAVANLVDCRCERVTRRLPAGAKRCSSPPPPPPPHPEQGERLDRSLLPAPCSLPCYRRNRRLITPAPVPITASAVGAQKANQRNGECEMWNAEL